MKKNIPYINQVIKNTRKEKRLTQDVFSSLINKSPGTIKRYDTGDMIPENTLRVICDTLILDYYELLEEQARYNLKNNTNDYENLTEKKTTVLGRTYKTIDLKEIDKELNFQGENLKSLFALICGDDNITFEIKDGKIYIYRKTKKEFKLYTIFTMKEAEQLTSDIWGYVDLKLLEHVYKEDFRNIYKKDVLNFNNVE